MKNILYALFVTIMTGGLYPAMAGTDHAGTDHHDAVAHPSWGYKGETGPAQWGDLHPEYKECNNGESQSPINIDRTSHDSLRPLYISYSPSSVHIVNNGHTIGFNYEHGSTVTIGDKIYDLLQFHFHTPSEHHVDGHPYPMEMHLVHKDSNGVLAVIAVMMKTGAENKALDVIWNLMPTKTGKTVVQKDISLNVADLFPADMVYFKYEGSLTTPPCTEGVQWHILENPIEISQAQLERFQALFKHNARPLMPLNGRIVKESP